jgi:hypothetical protein
MQNIERVGRRLLKHLAEANCSHVSSGRGFILPGARAHTVQETIGGQVKTAATFNFLNRKNEVRDGTKRKGRGRANKQIRLKRAVE